MYALGGGIKCTSYTGSFYQRKIPMDNIRRDSEKTQRGSGPEGGFEIIEKLGKCEFA